MNRSLASAFGVLILLTMHATAIRPASAAVPEAIVIDFEDEPSGAKANGYAPADAGGVTFSDTVGSDLSVADLDAQSNGQALLVRNDDESAVEIALPNVALSISLAFGNDDPAVVDGTDLASLTLFRGATEVGKALVNVNANDEMDQRIRFAQGPMFNRAVFQYVDAAENPVNLIEVIDDIEVGPICTIVGNSAGNFLQGTSGDDVICPGAGADTVNGGAGDDLVLAGSGADVIRGGPGHDRLLGGKGNDEILGGGGADELIGQNNRDLLRGGAGSDRLVGGDGRDELLGGRGPDDLRGGRHRDVCDGGPGTDAARTCEVSSRIP